MAVAAAVLEFLRNLEAVRKPNIGPNYRDQTTEVTPNDGKFTQGNPPQKVPLIQV